MAFLEGTLTRAARVEIEEHLASCSACTELTTWAAADIANRSKAPGREGRPFVGQLEPGARVGRYQILGAVGRGGMGEVYAAYHPDLDRRIALKVVSEAGADSAERRGRLLREARAIARLSHPNVVAVHDAGTVGDRVYIAMEFVDGVTLDQWVTSAPRSWRDVLDVFIAAGRGLAAAHAAEIVHRDFKPQNVMISKDGAVRVMDFGLARLVREGLGQGAEVEAARAASASPAAATVTKTGTLLGTPAYMAPEQFRGEAPDARADQFSFCVALHEALFGSRPEIVALPTGDSTKDAFKRPGRNVVPGWLRGVVLRGLSTDRTRRYESMDALLAALVAGRGGLRRRLSVAGVAAAVLLVTLGGWKIARGARIACVVPEDRLAAAWSGKAGDPRREQMRRAFLASGREQAETSWQRVSAALDEYVGQWRAMYLQTCEATHVRGEQSAEVLDLRMGCLRDNFDQMSALTNTLIGADRTILGRAVAATRDLTPVVRCADVALLKAAVPLPRDEETLKKVLTLRRSIADIEALYEVGKTGQALSKALTLRPEVDRLGYKPLVAQLVGLVGMIKVFTGSRPSEFKDAETALEEAVFAGEGARDDESAAKAASSLSYLVGYFMGRPRDAERWTKLALSILDRSGTESHPRIRAWVLQDQAVVLSDRGRSQEAKGLLARAIVLKERSLGRDHPDVGMSLSNLAFVLTDLGLPSEALAPVDRAISIYVRHGDPNSLHLALALINRGDALRSLGRFPEARTSFESGIRILTGEYGAAHPAMGEALIGVGTILLAEGEVTRAVSVLEQALGVLANYNGFATSRAGAQAALARALWDTHGDRRRARLLAESALAAYVSQGRANKAEVVRAWLDSHPIGRKVSRSVRVTKATPGSPQAM